MKQLLLFSLFISFHALGISPYEFNSALMEDMNQDIKQDRYLKQKPLPVRKPASIEREHENFDQQEYLRKNKVNGLHEKW
ncbi:MAG TPA: hypothetical protein VKZ84_03575 [Bacteriovoracaceae bacterium]|nr:hypothetical protein [Bacteriovoracaceae bacterium]